MYTATYVKYCLIRPAALALTLSFAFSCDTVSDKTEERYAVTFTSTVEPRDKTRATGEKWGNDEIGVFMKRSNMQISEAAEINKRYFTPASGQFYPATASQAIHLPENYDVDFIAYYPYSEQASDFTYHIDLTSKESQEKTDLLWSDNAKGQNRDRRDALEFSHQLAKLRLIIIGKTQAVPETTGIYLCGIYTRALFSLGDGILTPVSESEGEIKLNSYLYGESVFAEAIVLPGQPLSDTHISISYSGHYYRMDFPPDTTFEKGHSYTYEIILNDCAIPAG